MPKPWFEEEQVLFMKPTAAVLLQTLSVALKERRVFSGSKADPIRVLLNSGSAVSGPARGLLLNLSPEVRAPAGWAHTAGGVSVTSPLAPCETEGPCALLRHLRPAFLNFQ